MQSYIFTATCASFYKGNRSGFEMGKAEGKKTTGRKMEFSWFL